MRVRDEGPPPSRSDDRSSPRTRFRTRGCMRLWEAGRGLGEAGRGLGEPWRAVTDVVPIVALADGWKGVHLHTSMIQWCVIVLDYGRSELAKSWEDN